jgi:hypothetical protein
LLILALQIQILRAGSLTLAWDPSPDPSVVEYSIFYGASGSSSLSRLDVGTSTSGTLTGLNIGTTYSIYVVAIDNLGLESGPSNTLNYTPQAAPNLLSNGSFDSGFTGWTVSGNVSLANYSSETDHGQSAMFYSTGQGQTTSIIAQMFATVAGQHYNVSFSLGALPNQGTQGLTVSILGSSLIFSENLSATSSGSSVSWTHQSFGFTANNSSTLLYFGGFPQTTAASGPLVDNIYVGAGN